MEIWIVKQNITDFSVNVGVYSNRESADMHKNHVLDIHPHLSIHVFRKTVWDKFDPYYNDVYIEE